MGELSSTTKCRPRPQDEVALARFIYQYGRDPCVGTAGDLLSAAAAYDVRDGAVQLVAQQIAGEVPGPFQDIIGWVARDPCAERADTFEVKTLDSRVRVAKLRTILDREPRNSVRWVDLAREHFILGQPEKASKAMTVAVALAGCNRFVLRSASALYAQLGELDKAIGLLSSCPSLEWDPWLQAPLVALSGLMDKGSLSLRVAQRMLKDRAPAPQFAELAAALGTIELANGSGRRGRQLLRMCVEAPTENALAQAEWVGQENSAEFVPEMPSEVPRNFEAVARRAAFEAHWAEAMREASSWVDDQPFSLDALTFASYCACEGEDFDGALGFTQAGLEIRPDNAVLLNNHAFALISKGSSDELKKARDLLVRARKGDVDQSSRATCAATEAFWLFRVGLPELGRLRYKAVIDTLERFRNNDDAARAALMLANEEAAAGTNEAEPAWRRAQALAAASATPAIRDLCDRVERRRGATRAQPPIGNLGRGELTSEAILQLEQRTGRTTNALSGADRPGYRHTHRAIWPSPPEAGPSRKVGNRPRSEGRG